MTTAEQLGVLQAGVEGEGAGKTASSLYTGYETWKGWTKPFTYSVEEASYFAEETRGLAIMGAEVLEIGFGSGSFLAWARDRGAKVAGTEINAASIKAAQDAGIELIDAEVERIAHRHTERFDTIVAFDVFEHFTLDEIIVRLRAAETMLKPQGCLLLRFPNAQSPFGFAPQYGDPTHKTALSRSAFELLIQDTSFEVVRYGPSFRVGGRPFVKRAVRCMRAAARTLISRTLNLIYCQNIPWDPVVVLVLRKAV